MATPPRSEISTRGCHTSDTNLVSHENVDNIKLHRRSQATNTSDNVTKDRTRLESIRPKKGKNGLPNKTMLVSIVDLRVQLKPTTRPPRLLLINNEPENPCNVTPG
jgi:Cu/Ag efflux pump CusA